MIVGNVTNIVKRHLGGSDCVVGLMTTMESVAGSEVRLQTDLPQPPPFPEHRMVRGFRSRRVTSRLQLPKPRRQVIH